MSIVTGMYIIDTSMAAFLASAPNIPVYPAFLQVRKRQQTLTFVCGLQQECIRQQHCLWKQLHSLKQCQLWNERNL